LNSHVTYTCIYVHLVTRPYWAWIRFGTRECRPEHRFTPFSRREVRTVPEAMNKKKIVKKG